MRYQVNFTVHANTLQSAPVQASVKLNAGTITQILVQFRQGPHNYVFITISDGQYQLVPAHGSPALYGDGVIYTIPMDYKLVGTSNILALAGWSPWTRYDHTVTVWFDINTDENAVKDQYLALVASLQQGNP